MMIRVQYLEHFSWLHRFSSVQSLSHVRLFATPWIAAHQASLSITNSRSSLRLTSVESVMPSSHLILCRPLLLPPPIPTSIRVFSNESTLRMRWPKYWSFSFSQNIFIYFVAQNVPDLDIGNSFIWLLLSPDNEHTPLLCWWWLCVCVCVLYAFRHWRYPSLILLQS